ncbi:MAG: SDR family oxidoreductase [Polyangiaceae bacterium]
MSVVKAGFTDKVALITGGASGIGAALGRALARAGAKVVLADRQRELAERVASEIRSAGGSATAIELDVRSLAEVTRAVDQTVRELGSLDFMFNNAGIGVAGEIDGYSQKDWDDVIDVNLRGVTHGIQAAYKVMIRQGSGHIVNTASMAGLVGAPGEGSYGATKHAVVGLSKTLRLEARRHGVRVSVLCPGVIRTPILTGGKFGRLNYSGLREEAMLAMWSRARPMDADAFAKQTLKAIAANEAIIIVPRWWKALWYVERISPGLSAAIWGRLAAQLRADIEAAGATPRAGNSVDE